MRVTTRLKKILTWTNMSIMVLTTSVATPVSARDHADFGFSNTTKVVKQVAVTKTDQMQRQLACLARNVFYEARGESMAGQMAVAQVTVNRARSGLFPRDLCAVVSQHTVLSDNTKVCQFSWYCDADVNKQRKIYPSNASYIAAKRVLIDGETVPKIDQHVLWFHHADLQVNPGWNHKIATKIGNHVFYKRPTK